METIERTTVITYYGPQPCDLCGVGPIVRGSVEQGYGEIRLNYYEPVYPNSKWETHACTRATVKPVPAYVAPGDEEAMAELLSDADALRTKCESRWTAWMANREDGIIGSGETEIEAITNLARARAEREGA